MIYLTAGIRQRSPRPGRLGDNWVHTGVNPRLGKGGGPRDGPGQQWFHIRQNKHHRWSLDETQILQYHLGGALHPDVQWWEAMEVPRRSLQLLPDAGPRETLAAAERLRRAIRSAPFATGLDMTASIGVCDVAPGGDSAAEIGRAHV